MSGQQWGTAIGFVAGFFLPGGPQVWAAIGGAIGGYISPVQVQGPKLSDGMTVTAQDGLPNPWGFGTFSVGANVIWTADLQEHSHTDDGKGSGVEQETFTYTRSYALGICRANREEDGTYSDITGILRATHNNKVVYNTQPDATPEQLANNSKFLENHLFYLGGETQNPDPTIESYLGAGNVSAYRGQVYMVATDEDQTELQGAIGTWEFVVSMEGTVEEVDDGLAAGRVGDFVNAEFPLGDSEDKFTLVGAIKNSSGGYVGFAADTISEIKSHFSDYMGGERTFSNYVGYSVGSNNDIDNDWSFSGNDEQPDVTNLSHLTLIYGDHTLQGINTDPFSDDNCAVLELNENGIYTPGGDMLKRVPNAELNVGNFPASNACPDGTSICVIYPSLRILVTRKRIAPRDEAPPGSTPIPDAPGYYITPEGDVVAAPTHTPISGTFKVLSVASGLSTIDDLEQYTYFEQGPVLEFGDPDYNNQSYWEAAYAPAAGVTLPSGWVYGDDYPAEVGSVWLAEYPDSQTIIRDSIPLGTIVAEVCRRCGLEDGDIDVSQLTDTVDGFKVAVETTGESIISSLMPAYFFDCGEWDDKLRFIKRGGDAVFALTPDDLAERDGPVIEETEAQEVELLRKVHIRAMDPAAGYVETTQTAERRSSTVAADGEQTLALPVVMDKDTQARVADKRIKVAWAEPRKFKWTLPYTRPELTATDVGTITDRRGRTQRVRLMEMTEDGGLIQIEEAMLDRQSAYTSDVEGVTHNPPTDTSPGLIGPTFGVPMNLPSLRTQDNTPGAYIAACGYLSGWRACAVLLSVDGGASFSQVMTISQPSRMGLLTADVTASGEPIEVFMNSGEINSITDEQLSARGNAWAITSHFATVDAVSEIGQSKTANLTSSGGYELTENVRGGLGTTATSHEADDPFVMLSSVYFLPLDISLAGQILYFKFVSYGTSSDEAEEIPFLFNPIFTSVTIEPYTDDSGNIYTDDADNIYYYEAIS